MAALNALPRRVVVKIGSALLVDRGSGNLRLGWLTALAEDVAWLRAEGCEVVLVSSGSIALGRGVLGLSGGGELALEQSQAAAAVGQIRLARAYEQALAPHALVAAQVLVTLDDSRNRRRYLNAQATLSQLLAFGAVPIVNENDTVATDEIRFGDNDRLAAQVAAAIWADHVVLLSDVDGFYSANPQQDPQARFFPRIAEITPEIEAMAGGAGSGLSRGGMKTKVMAARIATGAGCALAIAQGAQDHALRRLYEGGRATWFAPQLDPQAARKRWIAAMKPQGFVQVDAGAVRALQAGKSLLPAGLVGVEGSFARADAVGITCPERQSLGQGLVRYSAEEARAVMGRRSEEIPSLLGTPARAAFIHRDDMVI